MSNIKLDIDYIIIKFISTNNSIKHMLLNSKNTEGENLHEYLKYWLICIIEKISNSYLLLIYTKYITNEDEYKINIANQDENITNNTINLIKELNINDEESIIIKPQNTINISLEYLLYKFRPMISKIMFKKSNWQWWGFPYLKPIKYEYINKIIVLTYDIDMT